MIGYWLLIAIPTLLVFVPMRGKMLTLGLWIVALIYQIMIGLRYEVGGDRFAYQFMFDKIGASSLTEAFAYTEPAYVLLNWLFAQIGGNLYAVNFIVAIFFVSGLMRFAKTTPSPWLALVSITPYLVIAIGMSAARQSAAIGLVFHLMAGWRSSLTRKVSISALAVAFHYSAVMAFIFVQQSIKMKFWLRIVLWGLGAAAAIPVLTSTDAYAKYQTAYLERNIVSPGALMHVMLNAIPATLYLLLRRKWHKRFGNQELLPMLSVLSLVGIFGIAVSSTGVDRLTLYLSPIQMMVYGYLPLLFGRRYRLFLSLPIIAYHLAVMYWWLNYANTAHAYIPYDNLITQWRL